MKELNFNNVKKSIFKITLPDENQTKLSLLTPTKNLVNKMKNITNDDVEENDLYELTAKVLSRNKENIHITADQLNDCLDFEDLLIFFNSYIEYVDELANQKN